MAAAEGEAPLRPRLPRPGALEWVLGVAGLGLVIQYRWLFDDAFIYFRYVDHLLFLDSGLVYNRGEYVEGFSSPLHCLLLLALRALELSIPAIVIGVGCVSYALFWYGLVVVNRRLSPPGAAPLNLPMAYLALNYSLTSFFTSGLETPLEHVAALGVALFLLSPGSLPLAAGVALAPLVRPELALAGLAAALFAGLRTRRFPWALAGFGLLFNGAWLLFRVWYYADLLPNTFYLKDDTEVWLGLAYLWDLARPYHLAGFVLVGAGLAVAAARGRAAPGDLSFAPRAAMALTALAVAAYVVRIGGGAVHYWYFSFAFPLFVCAFAGLPEWALARRPLRLPAFAGEAAMLLLAVLVLSWYPRQLSAHPLSGSYVHTRVGVVNDPAWHRGQRALQMERNRGLEEIDAMRAFAPALARDGYRSQSGQTWCRANWKRFWERVVHGFGLTDAVLARMAVDEWRPGHKLQLGPLAGQILSLQERHGAGPGMYRRALEAGAAPRWVERNLDALEILERKVYNRHDWAENWKLAFSFPPRIEIRPGDLPGNAPSGP